MLVQPTDTPQTECTCRAPCLAEQSEVKRPSRRLYLLASGIIERCVFAVKGGDDPAAMLQPVGAQEAAAHRLQVSPLTPPEEPHDCPLCPSNLCKVPFHLHLKAQGAES